MKPKIAYFKVGRLKKAFIFFSKWGLRSINFNGATDKIGVELGLMGFDYANEPSHAMLGTIQSRKPVWLISRKVYCPRTEATSTGVIAGPLLPHEFRT